MNRDWYRACAELLAWVSTLLLAFGVPIVLVCALRGVVWPSFVFLLALLVSEYNRTWYTHKFRSTFPAEVFPDGDRKNPFRVE